MPKTAPVSVDPLEALRGEVADLSRRWAELRGARETVLDAPRPPGEVRPGSTMLVERAAARFEPPLGWLAQRHGESAACSSIRCPAHQAPRRHSSRSRSCARWRPSWSAWRRNVTGRPPTSPTRAGVGARDGHGPLERARPRRPA
jgi:hypothetical protein